jgi:PAS domain-containing protein
VDPLRSLVDAVLDGAVVIDDAGVVLHANAAARRLVRDGDLMGRDVGDLLTESEFQDGRSAADLIRPDGAHIAVRLEVVRFGEQRAIVIHDGTPERLLDVERMPVEAIHQTVFGIAQAIDAYLFSGELTPDGYFVGTFTGPGAE